MGLFINEDLINDAKEIANRPYSLNEAYFGKTTNVILIEKAFDNILEGWNEKVNKFNMNSDKDFNTIKKALCDEFGFKNVGISIRLSYSTNAATIPLHSCLFSSHADTRNKMVVADKNGVRFKDEANMDLLVFFYSNIFRNKLYTGAELTAILLHEVGHNFTTGVSTVVGSISRVSSVPMFIYRVYVTVSNALLGKISNALISALLIPTSIPTIGNKIRDLDIDDANKDVDKILKRLQKENPQQYQEYLRYMETYMKIDNSSKLRIASKSMHTVSFTMSLIKRISSGTLFSPIRIAVRTVINRFLKPYGYLDERFADNFATMYGYGPEQITALTKMYYDEDPYSYIQELPIVGHFINIALLPLTILNGATDEHPALAARYNNIRKSIEREINSNRYDDNAKKMLQAELDRCDEGIQGIFEVTKKAETYKDPNIVYRVTDMVLYKSIGGDLRHIYNGNSIYKDIDDKVYGNKK